MTNPTWRLLRLTALTGVFVALAAACTLPLSTSYPAPSAGAPVHWEGDSITFSYADSPTANLHPEVAWNATPGATINTCPWQGCVDTTTHLHSLFLNGQARCVAIFLGTNDAYGWSQASRDAWTKALTDVPTGAHIIVVLPWVDPEAAAAYTPAIDQVRQWLTWAAGTLPQVDLIDWQPYARGVLGPDGIHLLGQTTNPDGTMSLDPAAAAAYSALVTDVEAAC